MKAKVGYLLCGTFPAISLLCSDSAALYLGQATGLEIEERQEDSAIEDQPQEGDGPIGQAPQPPSITGEVVHVIVNPTIGHCGEESESQVCASSNQTRLIIER